MSSVVGSRRAYGPGLATAGNSPRLVGVGRSQSAARTQRQPRRGSNPSAVRPSNLALASDTSIARPAAPLVPVHGLPAEIQRNRILAGAIRSLGQLGYADTSVAQITSRARVSRRTFYELFATREECLLAVFGDVVASIERDLLGAELEALPWRERVRLGLWTILSFLDREPALARVCIVHSLQGDAKLLAEREALLTRLAGILDEGRREGAKAGQATPLLAEGLVGAVLTILYTRVLRGESGSLTELLGELMGMIVLPYLGSAAARREQTRPAPALSPERDGRRAEETRIDADPFAGITMRLTYRTIVVLECVAARPGASNRQVGALAGVPDQGQISKLLARLERLGLLVNTGKTRPKGEANAWELTQQGARVTQTIGLETGAGQ